MQRHLLVLMLVGVLAIMWSRNAACAEATHGMVASVHPVATEAGLKVLKEGGNAVDAAVAGGLTPGVGGGGNSGIGGGCFLLLPPRKWGLGGVFRAETAAPAAPRRTVRGRC